MHPSLRIGVVVPAHDESEFIAGVVRSIPAWVEAVFVVDDASRDDTAERAESTGDPRVTVLRHERNTGVGGAMRTGIEACLERGLDVVVKMDGDGQMDASLLPTLIAPLADGSADMVKGNRYANRRTLAAMPFQRAVGNAGLSFLVKMASGYWDQLDPANGYLALRTHALREIGLERLPEDFYFESGLLVELGTRGAVVKSVPVPAVYGSERSDLSELDVLRTFPPRLLKGFFRRILHRYFIDDFSAVSVFLLLGVPLLLGGFTFGAIRWWQLSSAGLTASAGTVMLAALPFLLGFELLLQATVLDVQGVPRTPISPQPPTRGRSGAGGGGRRRVSPGGEARSRATRGGARPPPEAAAGRPLDAPRAPGRPVAARASERPRRPPPARARRARDGPRPARAPLSALPVPGVRRIGSNKGRWRAWGAVRTSGPLLRAAPAMLNDVSTGFVGRLRARDPAAWFELWETFGPILRAQLARWGGGRIGNETVKDLSQETLAALADAIDRHDPSRGARFSTWLLAIAKYTLGGEIDRRMAQKRGGGRKPVELEEAWAGPDGGPSPDESYEQAVFDAKVEAALRGVERESEFMDFSVYRMRVLDGRSGRDVADSLGISEATVSRRLSRVRGALRLEVHEVIAKYSFTEDELEEARRKGLGVNPTKEEDALFDEAIAEVYHRQARMRGREATP